MRHKQMFSLITLCVIAEMMLIATGLDLIHLLLHDASPMPLLTEQLTASRSEHTNANSATEQPCAICQFLLGYHASLQQLPDIADPHTQTGRVAPIRPERIANQRAARLETARSPPRTVGRTQHSLALPA